MPTRVTHQVRCRSKTNPTVFADVEVLDAVSFLTPDGVAVEFLITQNVTGVSLNPCIIDNTGGGNGKGVASQCSRLSHMERFTGGTDPTQIMDCEILDGWALQPPMDVSGDGPDATNDQQTPGGEVDAGDTQAAQHAYFAPLSKAITYVVDHTGLNLGSGSSSGASRAGHINLVTNGGNTDDKTEFSDGVTDSVPPQAHQWLATIKIDAISFSMPDGNTKALIIPFGEQDTDDRTIYTTDPYTGDTHAPPDNTDENVYVSFPSQSSGANLGAHPTSAQSGLSGPINQGIFWWIKKISGLPDPWFWYATVQSPVAWSFFGVPPIIASPSWSYRGFQLLNDFPVIWILSVNNPLQSLGSFGSPSLELCAEEGNWDTSGDIPNGQVYFPSRGATSGLNLINNTNTFGPFGYLPVLDPPLPEPQWSDAVPNIWQLTGITQPNLVNPSQPYDHTKNPYKWPSSTVWEQVAKTFSSMWDSVTNGVNGSLGDMTNGSGIPSPPPGWDFAIPYTKVFASTAGSFQAGTVPFTIGWAFPPEVFTVASAWSMAVDQLDQKKWDVRPALARDQGSSPYAVGNPITWASEAASGGPPLINP